MFTKGYRLFKLFGFEVKIDLSWLLLGVLVTWSLASGLFPHYFPNLSVVDYWAMGVAGAIGLLFSIVFHELSHSLVARRYGLPITGITLFIFGGVAEMQDEPPSPKAEFLMAVAGPLSSIFLAGILYVSARALSAGTDAVAVVGVFYYLSYLNGILGIFNLVPAYPLDGGRMFRAILWHWKKNIHSATRIASSVGAGFGVALIIIGVISFIGGNFVGGMWWFLIGLFLRSAANMSYRQLLMREAIQGEHVRKFMNATPVVVGPAVSIQDLVDNYIYKYHYKMFPVVDHAKLVGYVSSQEIKTLPREQWPQHEVREVAKPYSPDNTIDPEEDAFKAVAQMTRTGNSRLMVVDKEQLVGIIAFKDLMKFMSAKLDLDKAA